MTASRSVGCLAVSTGLPITIKPVSFTKKKKPQKNPERPPAFQKSDWATLKKERRQRRKRGAMNVMIAGSEGQLWDNYDETIMSWVVVCFKKSHADLREAERVCVCMCVCVKEGTWLLITIFLKSSRVNWLSVPPKRDKRSCDVNKITREQNLGRRHPHARRCLSKRERVEESQLLESHP